MNMICFDLDGTLEDSRSDMVAVVHRVRAALGLPPRAHESILPWVNRGMDPLYRACFDDYLQRNEASLTEIRNRYEADYLENVVCETRLYPGIAKAIKNLEPIGPLGVVTNKPERISRCLLEAPGIGKFFVAVIGGDTCTATKPDPLLLEEAADRCGFDRKTGRAVMIGDTEADIKMGRAFGAATIWCAWGYVDHPSEEPDFVAEAPMDLQETVQTALKRANPGHPLP